MDSYIIIYKHLFNGCEDIDQNYSDLKIQALDKTTRSNNLTELEEYSDYTITLTAINQAGSSAPAIVKIDTLETGILISYK